MNSLNVAKFGGTSMANYETMNKCAAIVMNNPNTKIVVVSASAGVTNYLVELGKDHLSNEDRSNTVDSVKQISLQILEKLSIPEHINKNLQILFSELDELAFHPEITHSLQLTDQLLSLGERMSSLLFTEVLNQLNHKAVTFDARTVIKTDSQYGCAIPDVKTIRKQAQQLILPIIKTTTIITQGFIGSDKLEITTTLGRGGSDYTASLLAEATDAETCEIWTDVPGVYTTDPRITDKATPLHELSFDEAAEMATFGAKVLHPDTMIPALRKNVHVFVGSSFNPEKGGTWIMRDCEEEPAFRSITRRDDQIMVTFKIKKVQHSTKLISNIFMVLSRFNINVDLITMSETAVSMSIDNRPYSPWNNSQNEIMNQLYKFCDVNTEEDFNLITIVGNNLHDKSGISNQIFTSIKNYPVRMICFGANPHNISFLVQKSQAIDVIKTLHKDLLEN